MLSAKLLAAASNAIRYYLRDEFSTNLSAGNVHNTAAEPGPGTRGITDLDSRITVADGMLKIAAGGTAGDRTAFWYDEGITRVAGQVVAFDFVSPAGGGNTIQYGLATTTGAHISNHINTGIRSLAGLALFARRSSVVDSPRIVNVSTNTTYRLYQVLRAVGQFVFLKSGSTVKFLWADEWDATPNLYFLLYSNGTLASNYDNVTALDNLRYTFNMSSSDSFNRADGVPGNTDGFGHAEGGSGDGLEWTDQVGTSAISSNVLGFSALDAGGAGITVVDTGNTDEYVSVEGTRAGGELGVVTRYVDANNYIRAYHDGANYKIDKVIDGVVTNVGTKEMSFVAGATLKIKCDGTSVWGWYDDKDADMEPLTISDAVLQTGTKHGVYSTNSGNTFDNWFTIPINGYDELGEF